MLKCHQFENGVSVVGYGKGLVGMRKIFLMAVLSVVCCDVWGVYSGAYKSYGVAAGTEQELTADMNFDTNMVVLAAGSTLRLSNATLKAFLKVDGGEATLVAPEGVDGIGIVLGGCDVTPESPCWFDDIGIYRW